MAAELKRPLRLFFPNGSIAYPPSNGPQIHKYQITKNLTALGYKITTLSLDQNPAVAHVPKRPLSVLQTLRQSDVIYLRTGEGVNSATRLTAPAFRKLIRRDTAVIWEMNLDINMLVRRVPRSKRDVLRDARDLRYQAERVDAAICVTRAIAEQAREFLGIEHAYTIQNGSDPEMFRPDLPAMVHEETPQGVLNIAWIASEANAIHDTALVVEVAHLIEQRRLPLRIHAMGDTAALFPTPVPSSVVIHGPVSYLDLPRYLSSMDVGLVLYNLRYDGGSPLKLFDYCASGCVPFCSPGQGIEDVLAGSGAGYVQWWTAESLCEALEALRREPLTLQSMSKKGRELVEQCYNWKAIAIKTDRIIRESVSRRLAHRL
jgi:glycosyltransferase involved in cell wall biosynthesis